MAENTLQELVEILGLRCPCNDPDCDGAWLTRQEANEVVDAIRELMDRRLEEEWEKLAVSD